MQLYEVEVFAVEAQPTLEAPAFFLGPQAHLWGGAERGPLEHLALRGPRPRNPTPPVHRLGVPAARGGPAGNPGGLLQGGFVEARTRGERWIHAPPPQGLLHVVAALEQQVQRLLPGDAERAASAIAPLHSTVSHDMAECDVLSH